MPENARKNGQEEQELLAAKPGCRSVQVSAIGPSGHIRLKNGKKSCSRGIDPSGTNLERSPTTGGSWGQVRLNPGDRGQAEPTNGLESQHGTADLGPRGALNVKPMVNNVRPHHDRSSWNAPL